MVSVFLDASVLFAAAYSKTGAARELIRLGMQGKVQLVVSQDALDEATRNLSRKVPERVMVLERFVRLLKLEVIADPTPAEVWATEEYVVQKDAPIVAAAIKAQVDFLATFDRKHLIDPPEVTERSGVAMVTPAEVIWALKEEE